MLNKIAEINKIIKKVNNVEEWEIHIRTKDNYYSYVDSKENKKDKDNKIGFNHDVSQPATIENEDLDD